MRSFKILLATSSLAALSVAQTTVYPGGVVNSASFSKTQAVAPGAIVAIFGTNLSSNTVPADTVPLSTLINNTSVTFNGIAAPLLFVASGQINAQMPWEALQGGATTGTVNIVVQNAGSASTPVPIQVASIAPGIYSIPPGAGYAVAINNADGSIAAPPGAIPGINTHPAKVNDVIILYASGLGPLDIPVKDGFASTDATRRTLTTPTLLLNNTPANIFFSGMTPQFPGINQINFFVPQVSPGNSLPLQLQVAGVTTTDQVVMAVQ